MIWRRIATVIVLLNIAVVLAFMLMLALGKLPALDRRIMFAAGGFILFTMPVIVVVGVQRRLERGRRAKFGPGFGLGVGLVDVIEGLTGKTMSPEAEARTKWIEIGLGVLALTIGLGVLLARRLGG